MSRLLRCLPVLLLSLSLACDRDQPPPAQPVEAATMTGSTPLPATIDGDPWWRHAVLYEIFVRSFADADGDGDGDLQGLISKLDYLNDGDPATEHDLGITGIWLMPICQSPSYHGYDVTDYYTVEQDYGSNDDFRELVAEAHRRGIRVIIDLVVNHSSSKHPWFLDAVRADSPYHDWYLWAYEGHTYRGPWGQAVWHQLPWWQRGWRHFNCLKYYGLFWRGMPDLNHQNPAVWQEVQEISRFWLQEMGVDGFRLDAARHLIEQGQEQEDTEATHQWLARFHRSCRSLRPDSLVVGEVWTRTSTVATYGPDELDLAFQFDLAEATIDAVSSGERTDLVAELALGARLFPDAGFASFLSNHDQNRVMWRLDRDPARAKLAATLLLTGPGVPFLYYGEEIGMTGHKPDRLLRLPMQWSGERHAGFTRGRPWKKPQPDYPQVNVAGQLADPGSLLATYRRLIHLRSRHPALRVGDLVVLDTGTPQVHAVLRRAAGETILVLANLAAEQVGSYRLADPVLAGLDPAAAVELLHSSPVLPGDGAGETGWRPIAELAPGTAYLVHWQENEADHG